MEEEIITSQEEIITPDIALELLKHNTLNRALCESQVKFFANLMKNGEWKRNGQTISIAPDGTLLNGQHRLTAIIRSGVPIKMLVARGVPKDSFPTMDIGKKRTVSDTLTIASIPNSSKVAAALQRYQTLVLQRNKLRGLPAEQGGLTPAEATAFYYQHEDAIKKAISVSGIKEIESYKIATCSFISGLYLYLFIIKNHSHEEIVEFCKATFGDSHTEYNVCLLLRRRLFAMKSDKVNKLSVKARDGLTAKAWNAYILKKDVRTLRWTEEREGYIDYL